MADNMEVTPGTGATVATDDVSDVHYQRVKLVNGALGGTEAIGGDDTNGLDVDVTRSALPTGAATSAKQDTLIGHVDGIEALLGTIDADTSSLAGTVSGNEVQVDVLTLPNVTLAAGTNTNEVVGDVAHDSAVGGNPILNGAEARDTLGTAVATGDVVRIAANRYGFPLHTAVPPSHASSNATPITGTTTGVISAPSAGTHLRVVRFHASNGGSTPTWVAIRDGAAGTQHYRTYLPQGGAVSLNLNLSGPLDLTTATRLDIVLSAAGSVEYEIDYLTVAD